MARTVDFSIKAYDTAPAFTAQLVDSAGNPVSLANVTNVVFIMADPDTKTAIIRQDAEILSQQTSIVRYRWQLGDTDVPGRYIGEWECTYDDDSIETFPNGSFNSIRILEDLRGDTLQVGASDSMSVSAAGVSS